MKKVLKKYIGGCDKYFSLLGAKFVGDLSPPVRDLSPNRWNHA